ncbi:hypothetical protein WCN79_16125 [Xanthomonas axonopodis pv. vasculorum]|uniref:hypothetical protein n=1 Tax=Xanthomonas axonopodis TaxID=53413 RepID=UPI001FD5D91C|nr:hypothetical protein [Xanthomonas axonopodis]
MTTGPITKKTAAPIALRSETRNASAVLRFPLGPGNRLGDLMVQFGYSHLNTHARPIRALDEYRPDIRRRKRAFIGDFFRRHCRGSPMHAVSSDNLADLAPPLTLEA